MSAAALDRRAPGLPRPVGSGLGRALGAELVRVRRTASASAPLVGLGLGLLQGLGWVTVSRRTLQSWDSLLSWQVLFATALCAPFLGLLAGLSAQREASAREGGGLWRPGSRRMVLLARWSVLAALNLTFMAALVLPMGVIGAVLGVPDPPVGRLVAIAAVMWLSSLGWSAVAFGVAGRLGTVGVVGLGLVWQIAGTLTSESPLWWAMPWAWSVRPLLPLLRVDHTGVPLTPGAPAWSYGIVGPLVASLALTVVALLVATRSRTTRAPRAGFGAAVHAETARLVPVPLRRVASHPVAAIMLSLRRAAIGWLTLGAVALLPLVAVVWRAAALRGVVGWVVLPIGACLLGVLVWRAQEPAFRVIATRRGAASLALPVLVMCSAVLSAVLVPATALLWLFDGAHVAAFALVGAATGLAGIALSLWLSTRFGPGAAIGVTLVGLVFSLVFGDYFADTPLWVLGPVGWVNAATTPARVAIACGASFVTVALASAGWARAAQARAARA